VAITLRCTTGLGSATALSIRATGTISAEWLLGVGPIVPEHAPELAQVGLVLDEFVAALVT
jgi:hypothetical protein